MQSKLYTIPSWRVQDVTDLVNKLNRKAIKLGLPNTLSINKVAERSIRDPRINLDDYPSSLDAPQIKVVDFELTGEAFKLAGWTFLATLDFVSIPGTFAIHVVPGQKVEGINNITKPICEHCNKIRARAETFIIRHDNGEQKQVGRQCLKDFLGIDPHAIVSVLQRVNAISSEIDDDEANYGGGRHEHYFHLDSVLGYTLSVVARHGYTSKAKAEEFGKKSTSNSVLTLLVPPAVGRDAWQNEVREYAPSDDMRLLVPTIREWVKEQTDTSEYMHNLQAIEAAGECNSRMLGYAVSMVACYNRAMGVIREKSQNPYRDEWNGKEKDKLVLTVTVRGKSFSENMYGLKTIVRMQDDDGRFYTWFASGEVDMQQNSKYDIRGTVKKLDEYQGKKITILTRVKYTELVATAE